MAQLSIPTDEQIIEAGEILHDALYNGIDDYKTVDWLRKEFFDKYFPNVEFMMAAVTGDDELGDDDLPRKIVELRGAELFEGKPGKALRNRIFDMMYESEDTTSIRHIYQVTVSKEIGDSLKAKTKECVGKWLEFLKETGWRPGGPFAQRFVDILRMDPIFAGTPGNSKPGRELELPPKSELGSLTNFQKNMKDQVIAILDKKAGTNRAILTLPTGAGKTRTAVDGIIDFLNKTDEKKKILWIAHSEELCEQAVQCFKQVWTNKGEREITIYRIWGTHTIPHSGETGIIVAGIDKLRSQLDRNENILESIADNLAGVFIDEAHGSIASEYVNVLNGLKMTPIPDKRIKNESENDSIPLIGLTATPERNKDRETEKLWMMYNEEKIVPRGKKFPAKDWEDLLDMRNHLIDKKYLSYPMFHEIKLKKVVKIPKADENKFRKSNYRWDILTKHKERNDKIVKKIRELVGEGRKILYFGSSVAQASALSRILSNEYKINSVAITESTRNSARRKYIQIFNENNKKIQVICNYNVLVAGFDAPKVDTIVIARPTNKVSYQQMIGRGLRGPKFNGTPKCLIVTVKENMELDGVRKTFGSDWYKKDIMNDLGDTRKRPIYRKRKDH
ncbi:DEAD/DEAH box helicase family protein [Candidatus Nitrosopelagicus sp.]|nr:DEAD/DEAH box helicase family protein [Candidatus Nitrosopelagicus sp.]